MDLWTLSDTSMLPNVNVRGGADSNNMMPQIIKCSKINLNMTNYPIKTGLPLRIFDLMGAGGFVISNYQAEIPEYEYRHNVRPGITGMAQVNGKYNTTVYDKLVYDLMYVQKCDIFTDLVILVQTVRVLFIKSSTEGV